MINWHKADEFTLFSPGAIQGQTQGQIQGPIQTTIVMGAMACREEPMFR